MSSISWAGAVSGDWATGSNWSGGIVPGANDDVTIGLTGAYTVHITTPVAANSLTISNSLATIIANSSLTLTGAMNLTGTFNLGVGGAVIGGTIVDSGSHLFCNGGTLNGVAYQGQLDLTSGGQTVTIINGITLSGAGGTGPANVNTNHATINFQGTQTFDNASVSLANSSINVTDPAGSGAVLTIGANTLIGSFNAATVNTINDAGGAGDGILNLGQIQVGTGNVTVTGNSFVNQGSVAIQNASSAHLTFTSSSFVNSGTISAAGGGMLQFLDASFTNNGQISLSGTTQLTIGKTGSSWTNSGGTISLSGGVLLLDGNFTTANLGSITGSGGSLKILGALDNSSGNLSIGAASAFTAATLSGSITNGFVNGPGGNGLVMAGGTLDGVSLAGNLDLSASGATGTIKHGITLAGASGTGNSTILLTGSGSVLSVDGTTLLNNATITLAGTLASTDQAATGAVLTLGPQTAITQTGATATLSSAMGAGDGIVLQGTLTVTASQGQVLNLLTPTPSACPTVNTGSFDTINLVNGQVGGTVLILNGGSFNIGNGTSIKGGTIVDPGSLLKVPGAGTLDGDIYEGVLDLSGISNSLTIVNGITFSGAGGTGNATINLTGTGSLTFKGNETADNVLINLGTNQNGISTLASSDPQGVGGILTLGPNTTIVQVGNKAQLTSTSIGSDGIINQGTITAGLSTGRLGLSPFNFTNQGAVNVSNGDMVDIAATNFTNAASGTVTVTTGATLSIDGTGAWSNSGTISETNATLNLGGNVTTAGLGNITRSGGTVNITGKLDNTGATIAFGAGTALGAVNLSGTIKNGTIQSTAAGFTGSPSFGGGTLDGVTYQGTLDMTTDQGQLTIVNGITFTGAGGTGAATVNISGAGASITARGNETFDNATINIGTNGNGSAVITAYDPFSTGTILTFGANLTINQTGARAQFNTSTTPASDGFVNLGTINAGFSGGRFTLVAEALGVGGQFTNSGTINASNTDMVEVGATTFTNTATGIVNVTTGATFTIDGSGSWSNAGLLSETGGTLILGGNFTTAGLGTVTRSGGTVQISGVLDNSGATIAFGGASALGAVVLTGTIRNGTIQGGASGLAASGSATLDGVTYQGTLDLTATQSALTVINGLTMAGAGGTGAGTINLTGAGSSLSLKGSQTLDNATINLGTSGNGIAVLYAADPQAHGTVVTLGANLVIQQAGKSAELEGQDIGTDGFINQGTINAGFSGGTLTLFQRQFNVAGQFTNAGAINASNSNTVEIGATNFTNSGTITAATGATLSIDGTGGWSSTGTISETGATLNLGGNFNTASLNTVSRSGGTVNLTGIVNNASGTINLGAGSALGTVNFSGTITGGTVHDAGGGLVANSGTLNGAAYQGTLDLSAFGQTLNITNGITLTDATGNNPGTINLTGFSASINAKGNETLDNATINIGAANTSTIVNYGSLQAGNILTLGPNLVIHQTGAFAAISGTGGANDGVINNGVINASASGGSFVINPVKFTNAGTLIAGASGEVVDLRSTNLTNLSGGTLTGGAFQASAGGIIQLANNVTLTTIQADVTESGASSTIRSLMVSGNTQRNIDSTLTGIGAAGALRLLSGHNMTAGGAFSIAGTLQLGASSFTASAITEAASGTIVGNGTVAAAVANDGLIEAKGGTLTVTGAITGSGSLQIDAGATLELGSATNDQQEVDFAGTDGTLLIDNPASYTGTIGGFDATQTIDLKNTIATSAVLNGTTLTIQLSGGGTQTYTLDTPLPNTAFGTFSDGHGGTLVTEIDENPASATVNTSAPLDFGSHHVGDTVTQAISITNSAPTGSPSAGLDVSLGTAPAGFTKTGSVTMLAAGATDATHLKLGLSTASEGSFSGTETLTLSSDDGVNDTALPSQTIDLQGAVYGYAAPSLNSHVINLGAARLGTGLSGSVTLSDGTSVDAFQESLDYIAGAPTGYGLTGAANGTIASGGSASIGVSLSGATAGNFSGSQLTLGLTSTGAGTSGLADTSLAGQTVMLNGKIYAPAVVHLGAGAIDFGNIHVGGLAIKSLQISNTATGGLTDTITGGLAGVTGGFSVFGHGTLPTAGIAAGAGSSLSLSFSTLTEGVHSGMATLKLNSHDADLADLQLSAGPVTLTGTAYAYADPILTGKTKIDFGATRVGATVVTSTLTVSDGTSQDQYQEALIYALGKLPAGFTTLGATSGTVASGSGTSFQLVLKTTAAGTFTNKTTTLSFISTGAKTSGLADTVLTPQTLTLSGKVYAKAVAKLATNVVDFGVVHVGDTVAKTLGVSNAATGALKDTLVGGFGTVTGAFTGSGTLGSGVVAGSSGSLTLGIDTGTAGSFTGTANLALSSHDADLANIGVSTGKVTLKGVVDNYAVVGFKKIGGAGTFAKLGGNYRLNLGTVTQNSAPISVTLDAFNAATGTADLLGGSFTIKNANGAVFGQTGFSSFSGLAAGKATGGMTITLQTTKTGTFTETITLSGVGSNASGYKGALGPVTLTVTGTIAAAKSHHKNAHIAMDDAQAKAVRLFGECVAAGFERPPAGIVLNHAPLEGAGVLLAAHH